MKFPALYWTRKFIIAFTKARHISLSWARSSQSVPPSYFLENHFILSYHLLLSLPSGPFPQILHQNPYAPFLSPTHATCPLYLILLDLITLIIFREQCRAQSSSLCSLFKSLVSSSLFGPNIFLSTLTSNNLSHSFSINVTDQVPHPHKTTGKIIILYILIFIFLESDKWLHQILQIAVQSTTYIFTVLQQTGLWNCLCSTAQ